MEKLLYTGKAKQMWQTDDPNVLRVVYMDQATALNGKKKEHFAGKGQAANAISSLVFQYLIKNGIPTHFIEKLSATEDLVKKCQMFPLEFVTRNVVAGHFATRYGLKEGKALPEPVEETFYKSDELDDPFINESGTIALGIASHEQLATMWQLCRQVNALLKPLFEKAGMQLVDFKLEFGRLEDGKIVLADEFSPDNCRLWDLQTDQHLDKDVYRRKLANLTKTYDEVLARLEKVVKEDK
ncbi:phosphoribosylaminoimidazolesuccinocarboxamide synthase [Limosilactobacillus frumenti DSM 13145]|uniref:Phosphoribosylaminoimidazole-succinocarboxamide synthase n=1 Tax=Limosilactobacillus frumenti DSM 13145 TaxID=1423746 RepID=A0A0R1P5R8_9LACO|nr:phosphoribosylaminoimidazolesuccinocarboxamide synthase [Limosilactobacillus frumenti]KRL27927.1 phosphoribosylaminoimidazolesuccinocarboxamide synthase [Limosilactobacillus frumenti DSM 13145]MBA2914372.1 phosphoribosylaminoimidazolesuccinocarboxamide synthase [Limosilactobacillus frumenti]QFG71950.1 phosphoribosylaminoimidazolesuccinocarboxamide synthase [Limosilactobacillus frumenti]